MKKIIRNIFMTGILTTISANPLVSAESSQKLFWEVYTDDVKAAAFYPARIDGLYWKGESPKVVLILVNQTKIAGKAEIGFSLKDFFGRKYPFTWKRNVKLQPKKKTKVEMKIEPPNAFGHYTVMANVNFNGKLVASLQTAFCVLPPEPKKRDPFFMMDKNGAVGDLMDATLKVGFGSQFLSVGTWDKTSIFRGSRVLEKRIQRLNPENRPPIWNSGLELVGCISPDIREYKNASERIKKGLFPLSDEELMNMRKYCEKIAATTKDKISLWLVQEEFDAIRVVPKFQKDFLQYLANYAVLTKNIYKGLKAGNPNCKVAVLGICCEDYYQSPSPFFYSKLVLDALGDCFDLINIDAYSGNWNMCNPKATIPEVSFRKLLFDAAALSASYGRPETVINAERCYAIEYKSPFDSQMNRDFADLTARSIIINKSAPSPYYSLHMATYPARADAFKKNPDQPISDTGIWMPIYNEKNKMTYIPRPAVAAVSTITRELAFGVNPRQIIRNSSIYVYIFQKGEEEVLALWSIVDPINIEMSLPTDATLTDIMGNSRKVNAGKLKLVLDSSPVFLRVTCDPRTAEDIVNNALLPEFDLLRGDVRRAANNQMTLALYNNSQKDIACEMSFSGKTSRVVLPKMKLSTIPVDVTASASGKETITVKADGKEFKFPVNLDYGAIPFVKKKPVIDGNLEEIASAPVLKLSVPKHVYPESALMPEYNIVKAGKDAPYANIWLGWDYENLYVASEVKDAVHIQRHHGMGAAKDDSFLFAINLSNIVIPDSIMPGNHGGTTTDAKHITKIVMALTKNGKELTIYWRASDIPAGNYVVKRVGDKTFYEAAIPWSTLVGTNKFKVTPGAVIGFNAMINNIDRESYDKAPYCLTPSAPGFEDVTAYLPFVLK